MGLSSLFQRKTGTPAVGEPADEVQQARTRARQRLIGAVVLLAIGIVGFPLVFETQPRPIPVDIPIEIPRKEGVPPLALPRVPGDAGAAARPASQPAAASDDVITETREEPPPRAAAPDVRPAPVRPSTEPAPVASAKPAPKPATEDGARARALLDGQTPPALAGNGRFVVQVGAFADASAAHDTRQRMEKLGLKTYTQVASTAAGGRIRVRVGPFTTREEADRALARARGAGLSGVVITL